MRQKTDPQRGFLFWPHPKSYISKFLWVLLVPYKSSHLIGIRGETFN